MKNLKSIILTNALIIILLNASPSTAQLKGWKISFLDSNNLVKSYSNVSLQSFRNDTLNFKTHGKKHKVSMKHLLILKSPEDAWNYTGMIIGGSIGFGVAVTISAILSGGGLTGDGPKTKVIDAIGGGLLFGTICGSAVGLIQKLIKGNKEESYEIELSGRSPERAKEEIKLIFKQNK
ncbi:MAG: hypothetical protein ABIY50_05145 [Ignavibacteria bacterium]